MKHKGSSRLQKYPMANRKESDPCISHHQAGSPPTSPANRIWIVGALRGCESYLVDCLMHAQEDDEYKSHCTDEGDLKNALVAHSWQEHRRNRRAARRNSVRWLGKSTRSADKNIPMFPAWPRADCQLRDLSRLYLEVKLGLTLGQAGSLSKGGPNRFHTSPCDFGVRLERVARENTSHRKTGKATRLPTTKFTLSKARSSLVVILTRQVIPLPAHDELLNLVKMNAPT